MFFDRSNRWYQIALMSCMLFFAGCASSFNPRPIEEVPFKERAQTQSQNRVKVTATVLSAAESEATFDVNLYRRNIQPVWLEIENNDDQAVWFSPVGLDPHYFFPLEASFLSRFAIRNSDHDKMDEYFFKGGLGNYVAPGGKVSGFVFTNLDEGTKAFNVDIVGEDRQLRGFTFFISVPGIRVDHHNIDWENLYAESEVVNYDETALRTALENMPCCTTNKKGTEQGDPLNLVIIGDLEDVYYAFIRAGWDETETIYRASVFKTIMSFLFGGRYRYSPVSALYVFGRPQDVVFLNRRQLRLP